MGWLEDRYTQAVGSIDCPKPGCNKKARERCTTSAVVHPERRAEAIEQGLWDPSKAQDRDPDAPFYAGGAPLEAYRPYRRK